MVEIFKKAAVSGAHRIFIMEDQVVFLCEFKAQFWQLLQNHRCGGHLFTDHQGGVLLLGAHEVTPDGLEHIESDRSQVCALATALFLSCAAYAGLLYNSV